MKVTKRINTKRIPLEPFPPGKVQRKSSKDDRIKPYPQRYLARIGDMWEIGTFTEQWYGWSLHIGSHSVQLNFIDELWEFNPIQE